MKTFGKKSISSVLRIAIDIMLIIEVLTLLAMLFPFIAKLNIIYGHGPLHYGPLPDESAMKILLFNEFFQFIFGLVAILITIQLRKLISSFQKEVIFEVKNVKRIKTISVFLFIYVIADFIGTLFKQYLFIHFEDFPGRIENVPISDIYTFRGIISTINFKLLFVSVVIYILACVFKAGNDLKEETTLTI
jgi:Protein of unknown function (DUF2975)